MTATAYTPLPPVPYDPELLDGLEAMRQFFEPVPLRPDTILPSRAHVENLMPRDAAALADGHAVSLSEVLVPGPDGGPEVPLSVVTPAGGAHGGPGIYLIHGGGMVLGNRFMGVSEAIPLVEEFGAVACSPDYRLAPEHPHPAPVEDCYAGLAWMAAHAGDLGFDPARLLVMGSSAGGGLAAAMALLARQRGGPAIMAQLLDAPMIDDRNDTPSARQYDQRGVWDRNNNATAWAALLGDAAGSDQVDWSAAPARATDFSGLPPAYIEVGAAEVFRDEAVAYASGLWAAGGTCELHVWSGAHHGFSGFSPASRVGQSANAARHNWLQRVLG
jgi:acetyl esterase/lipase